MQCSTRLSSNCSTLLSIMNSKEELDGLRKVITDYLGNQLQEELD